MLECRMSNAEFWSCLRISPSADAEPRRSMSGATGMSNVECRIWELSANPALRSCCHSHQTKWWEEFLRGEIFPLPSPASRPNLVPVDFLRPLISVVPIASTVCVRASLKQPCWFPTLGHPCRPAPSV